MVHTRIYKIVKIGILVFVALISLFFHSKDSKACTSAEPVQCCAGCAITCMCGGGTSYGCGLYRAGPNDWVCVIRHNLAVWPYCTDTWSATDDPSCTNADVTLTQNACPDTGLYDGDECRVADGAQEPLPCIPVVHCHLQTGTWDASQRQCVTCTGNTQNERLAAVGFKCIDRWYTGWPGCAPTWTDLACRTNAPDAGTFESACGADAACDELNQGDACGVTEKCDSNGQCVVTCGDGVIDGWAGEVCDGTDLGGKRCDTQGETGGSLACAADCQSFDVSGCYTCNDGNCEVTNGECRENSCGGDDCTVADCCGATPVGCEDWVGENVSNCSSDCSGFTCGDGICSSGECNSCPEDCSLTLCCGNGSCDRGVGESYTNCSTDCAPSTAPGGNIPNPLQAENIPELVESVGEAIFYIGMSLVTLMIVVGGIMFLTAAGNTARIATAKKLLLWTVAGAGVVLVARAISSVITYILGGR